MFEELKNMPKKPLELFLKRNKLKTSGTIEELAERIDENIKLGFISNEVYMSWKNKLLREGKKHIYIYSIEESTIQKLKNVEQFEKIKEEKEINKVVPINSINKPSSPELSYCTEIIVDNTVHYIKLLYIESKITYIPDYNSKSIVTNDINYYVFIDIDLEDGLLLIRLEPTKGLRETAADEETDEIVSASKIAQRYAKKICDIFEIETYDNSKEYQDILKELWKSTLIEIPEIAEKIDSIDEFTEAYINQCRSKLNIECLNGEELKTRINNYWEKVLLNEPFDEIDIQESEIGYITKEKIRGTSSQKLILDVSKNMPIHLTDYHYDIKAAVDSEGNLTYLRFNWNGLEGIDKEIKTILEGFTGFFRVIFTSYSVEEEIEHVLSGIKRFKNQI